jgi:protein TonB
MLNFKTAALAVLTIPLMVQTAQASPFGPSVKEFGGATPIGENRWITSSDYPESPLRLEVQGRVIVAFGIGADGKITTCNVESSSESPVLDEISCRLLQRRARFKPQMASDGSAVETKGRYSVDFWIPE